MKLTKHRLQKIISKNGKQTKKKYKTHLKVLKHYNTARNRRPFNLHNKSIKNNIKKPVLTGGTDAYMLISLLKSNNIPVVLGRVHSLPSRTDEDIDQPFKTPAQLQKAS